MRLDLFLKVSRLIPRRSVAQEFCDAGLISVNGVAAKASKEIKAGDGITINRRNRVTCISVQSVPDKKQVAKNEAESLVKILSEELKPNDPLA
ncbi:MAG TPA: S4 domain-containing protein [Pyrinomonadaceae bacterium]|jgi:ribosomal 50S subunit-recycling heat shock protein|nr:S4 domain-containing protein [Pyrinomonadaceae bacterium]